MENKFYVYVFLDQRKPGIFSYNDLRFSFSPFYVGVGCGSRMRVHFQPKSLRGSDIKTNIIKKIKKETGELPIHYRIFENLSQENAFEIEKSFIKHFGKIRDNSGILANLTDGGEGNLGLIHAEDFLDTMRRKIYQYDSKGQFIREWKSLKDVLAFYRKYVDLTNDIYGLGHLKKHSREEKLTAIGFQWRSNYYERIEPIQILTKKPTQIRKSRYKWEIYEDKEMKKLVKILENDCDTCIKNHRQLEDFLGMKASAGSISDGAKKKSKRYGYYWKRVLKNRCSLD